MTDKIIVLQQIRQTIKDNPNWYADIVETVHTAYIDKEKELSQMEAQLLMIVNCMSKKEREKVSKNINKDMFHPELVKALTNK